MYVASSDLKLGAEADSAASQGFRLVLDPNQGGGLSALRLATGAKAWSAKPIPAVSGRTAVRAVGGGDSHSRRGIFRLGGWALAGLCGRKPAKWFGIVGHRREYDCDGQKFHTPTMSGPSSPVAAA